MYWKKKSHIFFVPEYGFKCFFYTFIKHFKSAIMMWDETIDTLNIACVGLYIENNIRTIIMFYVLQILRWEFNIAYT